MVVKMSFDYIVYHRNCLDGFSSLLVAYAAGLFAPKVWFNTIAPNEDNMPHITKDHRVLVMDLNLRFEVVQKLVDSAQHVFMVDHHPNKDQAKILGLVGPKFSYTFDTNECASSIMWKLFFPNKPLPRMLVYIRDSDMGLWELDETQFFVLGLETKLNVHYGLSREMTFKKLDSWKPLLQDGPIINELMKIGEMIHPYQRKIMEGSETNAEIIEVSKPNDARKWSVVVSNGCAYLAKKLAVSLSKKYTDRADFAIVWYYNVSSQQIQCIVRSNQKSILWLLEMYGSGGHPNAGTFFYRAKHLYQWVQDHENRVHGIR